MTVENLSIEALLEPIQAGLPAGLDMRWTPEWDRLRDARRSDDGLETGKWQKRERKTADWRLVHDLAASMLRDQSKDLQVAMWLTEAKLKLEGFAGLRDGLRLIRELMDRYWDRGLYPAIEDGPEDRSGPFEWLNSKLVDSIAAIPITARDDGGRDYSFIDLQDARRTGSAKTWQLEGGEFDPKKKSAYEQALSEGHISLEMFEGAAAASKRNHYEPLAQAFFEALDEFRAFEKAVDARFGDIAPNLGACRTMMAELKQEIGDILALRRTAEPGDAKSDSGETKTDPRPGGAPDSFTFRLPLLTPSPQASEVSSGSSWQAAEALVRSGQTDKGLAEMMRLAANETSGRSRFQRKLLLAEVCLQTKRNRLARSILEELAENIDHFHLETWESSELISDVWTRLYRIYASSDNSDDNDRAAKLYQRLCRLDPWQALRCAEA